MPYRAQLKVRFGDIDHAGIVYYPRVLHYFHVAMEEFFEEALGIDYPQVLERHRFGLPTVHLETDFRRPLRYGDRIEVAVEVEEVGESSIRWRYTAYKQGDPEPVAEGRTVTVALDLDRFAKRPIPDWLRAALARAPAGAPPEPAPPGR
jgi:YbgC/YbaW family acyl-CoA thioester hydrolase